MCMLSILTSAFSDEFSVAAIGASRQSRTDRAKFYSVVSLAGAQAGGLREVGEPGGLGAETGGEHPLARGPEKRGVRRDCLGALAGQSPNALLPLGVSESLPSGERTILKS